MRTSKTLTLSLLPPRHAPRILLPQPQEADAALEAFIASPPAGASTLHPALMRAQLALEAGGAGAAKALELLSRLPEGDASGPADEQDAARSGAVLASRLALFQQVGGRKVGMQSASCCAVGMDRREEAFEGLRSMSHRLPRSRLILPRPSPSFPSRPFTAPHCPLLPPPSSLPPPPS